MEGSAARNLGREIALLLSGLALAITLTLALASQAGASFEVCTMASSCQAGASGGLGGEMTQPSGVATDASGNVYVVDKNNKRIQKFDSSGAFERAWGRDVNGGGVFGVCTVASSCLAGTTGGLGGEMNFPFGVATDASGNVYVVDADNNRIQKFSSSGAFERTWGKNVNGGGVFEVCTVASSCQAGSTGGLGGEMNVPLGVATDASGNVYAFDDINRRIQKFNSSGAFDRAWGKDVNGGGVFGVCTTASSCMAGGFGGLGGEMDFGSGVATDASGNVYVADSSNDRAQKFASFGAWNRAWGKNVNGGGVFGVCTVASSCQAGSTGGLGGEMEFPTGVGTDAAGNVYVADRNNQRIQKFDSSGAFERAWGNNVMAVPVAPQGSGPVAAAPSNAFTIDGLKGKTLRVNVSSAGVVAAADAGAGSAGSGAVAASKRLLKISTASGGPGTIEVLLRLTKLAKQKLKLKGKVRVNSRITFTPNGGTANSQTTKLKIRKR